jgi:hypothetical protein
VVEGKDNTPLVVANCSLLLFAGVGFCFWTIRYTDWFPVIGGLLGLTGAFAWIGVFSNLVTDERKAALQAWIDSRLLQSWTTCAGLLLIGIGFFTFVAARNGTLVVDASADDVARNITITPATSGETIAEFGSAPGTESIALLPTGLFTAKEYDLTARGLPSIRVKVRPLKREEVKLPNGPMTAPVILVRPTSTLSGISVTGEHALVVTADGKDFGRIDNYLGTAVWIGATRDVAIPRETLDRWRVAGDVDMNNSNARDAVLARWRNINAIPGKFRLQPGMQLRAAVVDTADKRTIGLACRTVTVPSDPHDFPEELVVNDNTDQCK